MPVVVSRNNDGDVEIHLHDAVVPPDTAVKLALMLVRAAGCVTGNIIEVDGEQIMLGDKRVFVDWSMIERRIFDA
jgi:hypothetical protein